jgi:hypothetical protein
MHVRVYAVECTRVWRMTPIVCTPSRSENVPPSEDMMAVLKNQRFEKGRIVGEIVMYSGPDCLSVDVPGNDKENTIEFHNGLAGLSHYIDKDDFIERFNNMI